jgi:MFS family permease
MENHSRIHFRHNYIVNLLDGAFFGLGLGFVSFSTILPLFVSTMTSSALLIGLVPAIHNTGWQLPQLLTANKISRLPRLKPWVMVMTTFERLPFMGLFFIALFIKALGPNVALVLTFMMLIMQGISAGLTANAWQNMIGKVIPGDVRATFFGAQSAASNLFMSGSAVAAGFLLQNLPSPTDFAICFGLACFALLVSWFFLNLTREESRSMIPSEQVALPIWTQVWDVLKKDKGFVWFLVSRNMLQFGMMSFGFYMVYAVQILKMSESVAGILTSVLLVTGVVANPLLGWLADHWNRKSVLVIGAAATVLSSGIAWLAEDISLFYVVIILTGIANVAFWTIGIATSLEFGDDHERATYVGMSNTLIAPSAIIAPIIGGAIADGFGYQTTFFVSAVISLITLVILQFFVPTPSSKDIIH